MADGIPEGEGLHPGVCPGGKVMVHVDADLTHGRAGSLQAEHSPRTEVVCVSAGGGCGGLPAGDVCHGLSVAGGEAGGGRGHDLILRLLGLHGSSEGVKVEVAGPDATLECLTAPEARLV